VLWRIWWGIHWELREHIENMMATYWELKGNIVRTREKWKIILSRQPPPPQTKT
jgi:hypothetical protein